ncbi:hypothetical protein Q5P01_000238 [Channa striata]|uniref:GTPase IMAP family member 8 n=1 Tax=Channa striata TaxID=64152 RepID=A0AA88LJ63_CHASR|nr:hypothetical protein Q5P01_000238 [Channa striata]
MGLVGHEKVGESSAGNTILGKKEFQCKMSFIPQTWTSEKREEDVLGLRVTVVDTPGLSSTKLSEEEVKAELEKAVDLSCPGPHVFLLTIQLGRFTEQEQKVLKTLEKMLSPDVSEHTMVLFTYGDRAEDTHMDQFIREDQNLQKLLKKCSGQQHVFNNKDMGDRDQVQQVFDKIEENVSNRDEEGNSGEERGETERWKKNQETQGEARKEDQRDDTKNETEDRRRQSEKPQEAEKQEKMRDSEDESQTETDEGKRKKRKHRHQDKDTKGETDSNERDGETNEDKMEGEPLKEETGKNGDKEDLETPAGPAAFFFHLSVGTHDKLVPQ